MAVEQLATWPLQDSGTLAEKGEERLYKLEVGEEGSKTVCFGHDWTSRFMNSQHVDGCVQSVHDQANVKGGGSYCFSVCSKDSQRLQIEDSALTALVLKGLITSAHILFANASTLFLPSLETTLQARQLSHWTTFTLCAGLCARVQCVQRDYQCLCLQLFLLSIFQILKNNINRDRLKTYIK